MATAILRIGTRSTGTMCQDDIALALVDMAEEVSDESPVFGELDTALEHWADPDIHDGSSEYCDECSPEMVSEMVSDAVDALSAYVPIYCYVGAHFDDPADYGVFADMEAIQESIRTGDRIDGETVVNVEDGVRIHVSDHGNVEVYSVETGESLISIV